MLLEGAPHAGVQRASGSAKSALDSLRQSRIPGVTGLAGRIGGDLGEGSARAGSRRALAGFTPGILQLEARLAFRAAGRGEAACPRRGACCRGLGARQGRAAHDSTPFPMARATPAPRALAPVAPG